MNEKGRNEMAEQYQVDDRHGNIKKIGEFIMDIDFTMMTTIDETGNLQSRPMSTQKTEFDGDVYFFTYEDTNKVRHIAANPRINLAYSAPDQQTYVSLKGAAQTSRDRQKMEELWSPELRAWFPDGLDTPGIILIKVAVETAEYWDSRSSVVAHAIGLVKSTITGKAQNVGDNVTLDLNK